MRNIDTQSMRNIKESPVSNISYTVTIYGKGGQGTIYLSDRESQPLRTTGSYYLYNYRHDADMKISTISDKVDIKNKNIMV